MSQHTHLTLTGVLAGVTLCGAERVAGGTYAHAAYAPVARPQFRALCCPACLDAWGWDADEPADNGQLDLFTGVDL
jgi:hypothetical protein